VILNQALLIGKLFQMSNRLKRGGIGGVFLYVAWNDLKSAAVGFLVGNCLCKKLGIPNPAIMFYQRRFDRCLSIGFGIGTVAARDYFDESNNLLQFNNSYLKEIKIGNFWKSNIILNYEFDFRITKKIRFKIGARYFTPTSILAKNTDYKISQGTGFAVKYGLFYQFQ